MKNLDPSFFILENTRLSEVLQIWLETVLNEFSISMDMVVASTSDSGSDVKKFMPKLIDKLW